MEWIVGERPLHPRCREAPKQTEQGHSQAACRLCNNPSVDNRRCSVNNLAPRWTLKTSGLAWEVEKYRPNDSQGGAVQSE